MKYQSAKSVFPESLLKEIQKYVQGELVYIPKPPATYKKWGEGTETKKLVARRNREIAGAFQNGATIHELAERYFLSEDTIRKIVYRKNV